MNRLFIYSSIFDRKLKELRNWSKVQEDIEAAILGDPEIGELIQGTHGLRKFRVSYGSKGKSGGLRVLYFDLFSMKKTYMITFFSKNEKENLSKEERNMISKQILKIKEGIESKEI